MVNYRLHDRINVFSWTPSVFSLLFPFLLFLLFVECVIAQEVEVEAQVPAPISVPPSTNWDGNDGPWSSFTVQVGSPPQAVRVLPSSSGSSLWVLVADGCTKQDPSGCPDARGGIFNPNASSTWVEEGLFELPMLAEAAFGYDGNGRFGYDSMVMSYSGGGGATVNDTVVAGIATKDLYIGTLGLTPHGTNFTDFNDPKPSILKLLRDSGQIPSRSWAYTAGAYYSPKKTLGSLLFGGYDESRFVPNSLTIGLGQDISRDILVGVQAIKGGEATLLQQGIIVYIDSTIPHIWLPVQVCQKFERAFGLTWDAEVELYLVNDTLHSNLLADNPTITFTIASSASGGDSVDIEMPYGAFDLEARRSLTSNATSRYFPLRRAQNETQYALGRTFLQQAYLIVDYDRHHFSVSQAIFPDTDVAEHRIPILDPAQNGTTTSRPLNVQEGDDRLGTGAIVGIVIGAVVAVLIAATVTVLYFRRRRLDHVPHLSELDASATRPPFQRSELDAKSTVADDTTQPSASTAAETDELTSSNKHTDGLLSATLVEAPEDRNVVEMPGSSVEVAELAGSGGGRADD